MINVEANIDENKRIMKGTEHAILNKNTNKIGGSFELSKSASFIEKRAKIFDKYYEIQNNFISKINKTPIKITLIDGKVVEGKAMESTPYSIAKSNLKRSLLGDFLVAKVRYSNKVVDFNKGLFDTDIDSEHDNKIIENNVSNNKDILIKSVSEENLKFELWDMERPLEGDCFIEYVTFEDKIGQQVFWHSSAHILGYALEKCFGAYLCIGPPLNEGFYYDAYMGSKTISEEKDYKLIKEAAESVIKANYTYKRLNLSKEEALELFADNPFKVQLITSKIPEGGRTSAYKCGSLIDLCLGPHLMSTGVAKYIEIYKNSSCYWLSNDNNDSLQRVYGITFPNKEFMENWKTIQKELAQRHHKFLGKNLFMFHELSPGCAFFYPDGAFLYNKLMDFIRFEYSIRGFQEVISPNLYNIRLWKTSGHYKNYQENLFMLKVENQGFGIKPMNCPGHCLMFDSKARSYKELPIRYADFGVLHRNEISGALSGLTRVRRFQQDDAHIFCDEDKITEEIVSQLNFLDYVYTTFGFKYDLFLSTKPDKALGDSDLWEKAELALTNALNDFNKIKNLSWKYDHKGGAFYGPKIDIKLYDALGRSHQCGTIQLDFQLPIRFNLQYRTNMQFKEDKINNKDSKENTIINKDIKKSKKLNKKDANEKDVAINEEEAKAIKLKELQEEQKRKEKLIEEGKMERYCCDNWDPEDFIWEKQELKSGYKRPVIIHRAILGSVERMLAILIEHTKGKFPFWLSPKQAIILTVSEKFSSYAKKLKDRLNLEGFRVDIDCGKLTLPKKVALAQIEGYNYILVVGSKEVEGELVDVRDCRAPEEKMELGKFSISKLLYFFKSLEPFDSNALIDLKKGSFVETKINDPESLNSKLINDLFIGGDVPSKEDYEYYDKINNKTWILPSNLNHFPNLNKWLKLMKNNINK